jgi:hypothetical protein
MGGTQDNYENDPYIKQSQQNNAIKNLYSNQSLNSYDFSSTQNSSANIKQLSEQQEKLNTTAFQNPIKIVRNSITLEQDAYNRSFYYISFEYTCDRTVYANIYFNTEFNPSNKDTPFIPSPPFINKTINICFQAGQNVKFQDPNLKMDMEYFIRNRVYDKKLIDLILELYVMDENRQFVECTLATFCSITFKPGTYDYKIKYLYQKVKVRGSQWYHIEDIYGLTTEDNLCSICCVNPRNTFFLPCKHSYTCQECAILIRAKDDKCPICREKISDSVILKNVNANPENMNENGEDNNFNGNNNANQNVYPVPEMK